MAAPSACPRPSWRGCRPRPSRTRRRGRRRRRRRARWSRRPSAGPPARRGCRPGTASAVSLATMPPSTFSSVERRRPESAFIASTHLAGLEGRGLQRGPGDVPLVDVAGQADDRAARVGAPVRREQAGERRHEVGAAVVLDRARPAPRSPAAVLIRPRLSRSHCTSEPVTAIEPSSAYTGGCVADLVADRGEQAVLAGHRLGAGVEQQEVAGAVGVLGLADRRSRPGRTWPPAGRRGSPAIGTPAQHVPRSRTSPYTSEDERISRQHRQRDAHLGGDVVVPVEGVEVHQHGAGGVGRRR